MKARAGIAAAVLTAVLGACGPQGKVTESTTAVGSRTYLTELTSVGSRTYTEWHEIDPGKLLVNFSALAGAEITWTEQRIRDNHIIHQRVDFDGRGRMTVEHLRGPNAVFRLWVTEEFNDMRKALADMKRFLGNYAVYERGLESGRIRSRGSRGGLVASAPDTYTSRTCVLGVVAFLSRAGKNRSSDEHYDTIVRFRDCSGKRSVEEVKDFLNGLRIVSRA